VFEGELLYAAGPLRTPKNVYLSPHCVGSTEDAAATETTLPWSPQVEHLPPFHTLSIPANSRRKDCILFSVGA